FCEKLFQGYTIGKLLTGTRAVRNDGKELTWKDAIVRSLCRMIPFEVLSGFAYRPWHDSITKTTVVQVRR
ncbi:MAG TPA: RDD family protein, partial [Chitinophagaceae bacterium]|nr:RDD family protein [Chitinophagaceae bacterium]